MVAATRERRAAEDLDDQAKQAVERDDARDDRTMLDVGTMIRVVFGVEKFSPVQFHTLDIGGTFVDVKVRPGESVSDAWKRGFAILRQLAADEFDARLPEYLERVKAADRAARSHGR